MSKIITGAKFGRGKDLNGNPRPGYAHPTVDDGFDRARVRCGVGQIWALPDGHKYSPVRALPDTDTYRNCVEVSVLSPSGDVLENRVVALAAFAAYKLESDPSEPMPERRKVPVFGAAAQFIKVGVSEDFAIAQGTDQAEISAGINFAQCAVRRAERHLNDASEVVGHAPWIAYAASLGKVSQMLQQVAEVLVNQARHAEALALRDMSANDVLLLSIIATAPPEGYDMAGLAARASDMLGPSAIASFHERAQSMVDLGWLAPASGSAPGAVTHIGPGERMFTIIFHPLAEAAKPGDLN